MNRENAHLTGGESPSSPTDIEEENQTQSLCQNYERRVMKHPPNAGMRLQESYAETKQRKAEQSKQESNQTKNQKVQLETTSKRFNLFNIPSDTSITEYTF